MTKCNSHAVLVRSCSVPRKSIVHSEFPHKTQIYATILKSIKNADFYFFIDIKQYKILVCGKKYTRKGETTLKKMDFKKVNNLIVKSGYNDS